MIVDVGYGLWALCEGEVEERLSRAIRDFALRYGGPPFPPHLTLASFFESEAAALRAAEDAATTLGDARLTFDTVETAADYHRALYLRAVEHPALTRCHADLVRRTGRSPGTFVPHVSLFYGHLGREREHAVAQARALLPLTGRLSAIEVWHLKGAAPDWRRCAAVELRAP